VATGGILLGILLSWWATARVTRPVLRLADSAAKVAAGNWNATVEIASGDEIGQLAGAATIVATCHGWNPNRPPEYDLQDAAALQQCAVVTSPSKFWADRLRREWLVPRVEVPGARRGDDATPRA